MFNSIFVVSFLDKQKTIDELLKESRDSGDFYFLLGLSTFITTLGILIDSVIVLIGGMLVAPILFPILSLAMGVVTFSRLAFERAVKIILRAIVLIIVVSFITAFLFDSAAGGTELLNRIRPDLFLFLISFAAGLAVSFAWVRQELSAALPGVAVSVSLIVPLTALGIGLTSFDRFLIADSVTLFFIDMLGIVLAGIVIFALFGFSNLQEEEDEKITEEALEKKVHQAAVKKAATKNVETYITADNQNNSGF